jgi:hypothetical protein
MNTLPDMTELQRWRTEVKKQIEAIEMRMQPLVDEISSKQQELSALDQLIRARGGDNGEGSSGLPSSAPVLPFLPLPPNVHSTDDERSSRSGQATYTSVYTYWPFILSTINELGGTARGDAVIELVGKKMENILTPDDKERLASGTDVRWRNRVAWQRFNMVRDGLLKSGSPRGTWEITDEGRKWLARVLGKVASSAAQTNSPNTIHQHEAPSEKQGHGGSDGSV